MAQIQSFVLAVYCYAHAFRTCLRQEPLSYFSKAGPFYDNLSIWKHRGITIWPH